MKECNCFRVRKHRDKVRTYCGIGNEPVGDTCEGSPMTFKLITKELLENENRKGYVHIRAGEMLSMSEERADSILRKCKIEYILSLKP